jgi:hypothetical protein
MLTAAAVPCENPLLPPFHPTIPPYGNQPVARIIGQKGGDLASDPLIRQKYPNVPRDLLERDA